MIAWWWLLVAIGGLLLLQVVAAVYVWAWCVSAARSEGWDS